MPFLQLTFDVGAADPSPLEEALFDLGATSVTLEDAADSPILEPRVGTTPLWPTVRLRALFDASTDRPQLIRALHARLGASIPPHQSEQLADRAWEREWLKDFKPMRFGERLWICPGGQHPAADLLTENVCLLHLDPGLAFGTGTHPTTALCLEWLDGHLALGVAVIDYGWGSGILVIAAARLGAVRRCVRHRPAGTRRDARQRARERRRRPGRRPCRCRHAARGRRRRARQHPLRPVDRTCAKARRTGKARRYAGSREPARIPGRRSDRSLSTLGRAASGRRTGGVASTGGGRAKIS